MLPKILLELCQDLESASFIAENNVNGEGRLASLIDEGNIKNWMKNHTKWCKFYKEVSIRKTGDFHLKDDENDLIHIINIKTTKGSTDNATSMVGFLYALTDLTITELPSFASEKDLVQLVKTRANDIPFKDYYYLTFDKNNMNKVFIRGAKQIVNWVPNASNKLQINWSKEWASDFPNYSYEQTKHNIIGGLRNCWDKLKLKMPEGW
jgi:hypothetical protein